jgi:hypothetical protein
MYFVKNGDVYGVQAGTPMSKAVLIASGGITQEPGYLYYIDANGDIARKSTAKPAAPARPPADDDDDDDDGDDDDEEDDDE